MAAKLRQVTVHTIGTRPLLVLGCDRELLLVSGVIAFAPAFAAMTLLAFLFGVALWAGALFALRRMAKADPQLRGVYARHVRYKRYYSARSTPFRANTAAQGEQYR